MEMQFSTFIAIWKCNFQHLLHEIWTHYCPRAKKKKLFKSFEKRQKCDLLFVSRMTGCEQCFGLT